MNINTFLGDAFRSFFEKSVFEEEVLSAAGCSQKKTYRGPLEQFDVVRREDIVFSFRFPNEAVKPVSEIVETAMKRFDSFRNFYMLYGMRDSRGELKLLASPLGEDEHSDMVMIGFIVRRDNNSCEGLAACQNALDDFVDFVNCKRADITGKITVTDGCLQPEANKSSHPIPSLCAA